MRCRHFWEFMEAQLDTEGITWYTFYCKNCLKLKKDAPEWNTPKKN
jgi:hypothetical protein